MADKTPEPTEFLDVSKYEITHTEASDTGLRLFSVRDKDTDFVITFAEFNKDFDVTATSSWIGATTSRKNRSFVEAYREVVEMIKSNPQLAARKIEQNGLDYGHSSILGMAPIFLYINNLPIEMAFWLFNHMSIGDGQESSTRYIEFNDLKIPIVSKYIDLSKLPEEDRLFIEQEWVGLQNLAAENYNKWQDLVTEGYTNQFIDGEQQPPISEKSLKARVLDVARMWLPIGAGTSMCILGNLRLWNDFVLQLRETGEPEYMQLAEQLSTTLKLEKTEEGKDINAKISDLVKYTEPRFTIRDNLEMLNMYLPGLNGFDELLATAKPTPEHFTQPTKVTKVEYSTEITTGTLLAMQYIMVLYPGLDEVKIVEWLNTLSKQEKRSIGSYIMHKHMQHNVMRNMGDIRGHEVLIIETAMAYIRDLNRHRAEGRFIPYLETDDYQAMINDGFNTNYQIMETDGLKHLLPEWKQDADIYYEKLNNYYNFLKSKFPNVDLNFIRKMFPLGHQVKMHMSGPITQLNYMVAQRIAEGGDLGYRDIVFKVLTNLREDDYLVDMLEDRSAPDANDREEFRSRK